MTATLITTSGLVTGVAHTFAANGDALILAQGVAWGSSDDQIITSGFNLGNITILGNAFAAEGGITMFGFNSTVTIGSSGSLTTFDTFAGDAAIVLQNGASTVVNEGLISASKVTGVAIGPDSTLVNSGTIAAATGVRLGIDDFDVGSMTNSGSISANFSNDTGVISDLSHGVTVVGKYDIYNLEGGSISAVGSHGAGVYVAQDGSGTINNYGEITSADWYGVDVSDATSLSTRVVNTGTLQGQEGSYSGSDQNDTLVNSGPLIGFVEMNDGDDAYEGFGGQILFGQLFGDDGNDTFYVDQEDLVIFGGNDYDELYLGASASVVEGMEFVKMVGTGDFAVITDDTNSTIVGNAGNNLIEGMAGNDTIRAGIGDDELYGGADRDLLVGGVGSDVFIYKAVTDSTVSNGDRIRDLNHGDDVIDLSELTTGGSFIGTSAFSGTGAAEVNYKVLGGVNSRIEVDVDGDGNADMRITANGITELMADDFIL